MACGAQHLRARHRARRRPAHGTGSTPSPSSSSPPRPPALQSPPCPPPLRLLPCLHRTPAPAFFPPPPLHLSLSTIPAIHRRHLPSLPPSPFPPPSTIEPLSPSSVAAVAVLFSSHFLASMATPSPVFSSPRHRPSRLHLPLLLLHLRRAPPIIAPHSSSIADNPASGTIPPLSDSSTVCKLPPLPCYSAPTTIYRCLHLFGADPSTTACVAERHRRSLVSPPQPPSPSTSAPLLSLPHRRRLSSSSIVVLHGCRPPPLAPTPTSSSTGDLPLLPRFPCHCRFLSFVLPSPTSALTTVAASLPPFLFPAPP